MIFDPNQLRFEINLKPLVSSISFDAYVTKRRLEGFYLVRCSGCKVPYEAPFESIARLFLNENTVSLQCSCGTSTTLTAERTHQTEAEPTSKKTETGLGEKIRRIFRR